ncbi:hypothetical protein Gohar_011304, partial [Gossypium harknessii]|nr:hypothetical protein [Gossypium harknessii]
IQGWELANPQRSFTLCALRGWVITFPFVDITTVGNLNSMLRVGTEVALKSDVALSPLLALVMTSDWQQCYSSFACASP